jgi:type II secretory pathway component GspD/PulD (secretin)
MKSKFFLIPLVTILFVVGLALARENSTITESPIVSNKISLDIKGMDIVDVLKMLAQRQGLNIVVGKNVTGRVTLFLKDVDVWSAFEIILLSNELAYEKKGDIINVMTQRDYELMYGSRYEDKRQVKIIQLKYAKVADLSRSLNQIKTAIGNVVVDEVSNTAVLIDSPEKVKEMQAFIKSTDLPLQTQVFSLNYAQADKLSAKLQEAVTKGAGSIKIDERTNKIAVTDYPQKLEEIAKVIVAFDEKTPQVLIDAQIVEITPSDQFQMGVDWNYWIRRHFQLKNAMPLSTYATGTALFIGTPNEAPNTPGQYKAIIDLLRTIGDTKILSSPRIMAVNNQEAKILVGTKDAYVTQTTSQSGAGPQVTADQVNFVDVGIKLYVTPTVNRDNFVTMKIRPEISSSTYRDFGTANSPKQIPIVTTSESETTVMVRDGITLIIGGLRKDKRTKTVKKIPLIGDIPGLGFLFRSTDDKVEQNELVILLTPHIMSGESSLTDFSEIKPKDGAIATMEKGKIITRKVSSSMQEKILDDLNHDTENNYYQLIIEKINSTAKLNPPLNKGEVDLNFSLGQDGRLLNEPRVLKATNPSLIPFAIKAVKQASPFKPFPKSLAKDKESFKISLAYE